MPQVRGASGFRFSTGFGLSGESFGVKFLQGFRVCVGQCRVTSWRSAARSAAKSGIGLSLACASGLRAWERKTLNPKP